MEIQFSSALLQDRSAVWNKPSNDSIQFLVQFNRRIKKVTDTSDSEMRWVLEWWDNGTVYFFYIGRIGLVTMPQRCQWDTVSCDVWPGMSKNHLWLCFGDVLTSTRQWLLTDCTPVAILAMEKFRYCCSSEFLCEWDWLILKECHWPIQFAVPGQCAIILLLMGVKFSINQGTPEACRTKNAAPRLSNFQLQWGDHNNAICYWQLQSNHHGMILAILSGHFGAKPETRPRKGILVQFNSGMTKSFTPQASNTIFWTKPLQPIQQQCHANTCPCNNIYFYKLS